MKKDELDGFNDGVCQQKGCPKFLNLQNSHKLAKCSTGKLVFKSSNDLHVIKDLRCLHPILLQDKANIILYNAVTNEMVPMYP